MRTKRLDSRHDWPGARFTSLLSALCVFAVSAMAQHSRITRPIDNAQRVTLRGHLHPQARLEDDQGRVSPSLALSYVTLTLAQSDSQKADLDQLLSEQQTPGSPNYHRWITPEEYAQRFWVSDADLNQITTWLRTEGLTIAAVARGRNWIAVNGSATKVEQAFQIQLHHYLVHGEMRFANSTEPSVPAALGGVVGAIRGINDFRLKPARRVPLNKPLRPDFTSSRDNHYLAPDDLATIYNLKALYATGIDGSGQKLVIAGQTQISLSDIQQFRSSFNLPANDPQIVFVPNSRDPGTIPDDVSEADLDLEWSGAVARKATIIYVYTYDVMQAVQYTIDQNLAPVVSVSYGGCEQETSSSDAAVLRSWAKQGNAQGITWFAPSGDDGGADCNDPQNSGLAVELPASIPEVTGVGGTEFVEGSGQYWNSTNGATGASVLSYIPETTWNASVLNGEPAASGGGASILFSKPSWQTGVGVPGDNARHVPDVALNASADHDGYIVYTGGSLNVFGGTSVPTPAFAGIAALLNQYLVSKGTQSSAGLGNMNPNLYSLAQTSSDVFHDITTGTNIVTVACPRRSPLCTPTTVGYSAGAGYDQITGLGSVDAYKLITKWNGGSAPAPPSGATITLLTNVSTIAADESMFLTATVTGPSGVTPTGAVAFAVNGSTLGSAALVGSAGTATATLVVKGFQLPQGAGAIIATYSDGLSSVTASVTASVTSSGSSANGAPTIAALANGASYQQAFATGGILTVFGSQLAPSAQSAGSVPLPISTAGVAALINGVAAPLYYVSPGQLNIQVPYETPAGGAAVLSINNNGQLASQSFLVAAAAPGIFTDQNGLVVPTGSAARGEEIAIYLTGAGAVSPEVSTGAAPSLSAAIADLPKPAQTTTVTVGGVQATLDFVGIPSGLVGVTQINLVVPNGITLGTQPLVVTVGGVSSATAKLSITQ